MRNLSVAAIALLALFPLAAGSFVLVGPAAAAPSWAVQVAGAFSEAQATAVYDAMEEKFPSVFSGQTPVVVRGIMAGGGVGSYYRVVIPAPTRMDAESFCDRLMAAGGACVVKKTELPR